MTGHYSLDELSDWMSDSREASPEHDGWRAEVAAHVDGCADCAQGVAALREVGELLASEPVPAMPADVFGRLSGVVVAESQRRTAAADRRSHHAARPGLGAFDDRVVGPKRRRLLGRALASVAVAAAVGFGGYVLSATAGLNEPVSASPVSIDPATLSSQAAALRLTSPSDPHRFSKAWRCARKVTDGRIVGIRPVMVTGEPAYLVYLDRSGGGTDVSVVRGCGTSTPSAGPTVALPDR